MNLVFFDFCETLVNFTTPDVFVDFCMQKTGLGKSYTMFSKTKWGEKFLKKYWRFNKKVHLLQLKSLTRVEIDKLAEAFYIEKIVPNLHEPIVELLDGHKENGDKVYIVSGGYSPYINCFAKEHEVDGVISNDFLFDKDVFQGKISSKDCIEEEKVIRTAKFFEPSACYEKSIFYSDSYSDLPLFRLVDRPILVSREKRRRMAKEYGLEQIVISEMEQEKTKNKS